MSFYPGLQSTAARLLADKGRQMTLRKRTPGTYNPSTASAALTTADTAVTGGVFDYAALLIDGTSIQRGDKKVVLAAQGLAVEPDTGDLLLIGGVEFNVISVQPVAPAGVVVIYILQVRR